MRWCWNGGKGMCLKGVYLRQAVVWMDGWRGRHCDWLGWMSDSGGGTPPDGMRWKGVGGELVQNVHDYRIV